MQLSSRLQHSLRRRKRWQRKLALPPKEQTLSSAIVTTPRPKPLQPNKCVPRRTPRLKSKWQQGRRQQPSNHQLTSEVSTSAKWLRHVQRLWKKESKPHSKHHRMARRSQSQGCANVEVSKLLSQIDNKILRPLQGRKPAKKPCKRINSR